MESAERSKDVETALQPLTESFAKHDLVSHKDKDVRLLVAICATELFRILAPEPPFEDGYLLVNVLFNIYVIFCHHCLVRFFLIIVAIIIIVIFVHVSNSPYMHFLCAGCI